MLERLGTPNFAIISLFLYLFFVSFQTELMPRWPPDSNKDPSCIGPVAHPIIVWNQTSSRWCGAEVWRRGASSGVVLVTCQRFNMTRSVPK
ncbi:hypothetical protein AVEN_210265-1 [Araneus ventricosus]|uniref:Uncharacterized protein n=1 Tax=Araneus ventricosus TaxID=182803 RepID=A0A4Y2HXU6_ARAVE|nr:hypothetical protein AVEN_210265-1 [Araneus ventricosus]